MSKDWKLIGAVLAVTLLAVLMVAAMPNAPREPQYSALMSFPEGCTDSGVTAVLSEITWKHTKNLEAVEATLTITIPSGAVVAVERMTLARKDRNKGEMSLFLDISPEPNEPPHHGFWIGTGRLVDGNGVSLGEEWSDQISC